MTTAIEDVSVKLVDVTPQLAEQLLQRNQINRRVEERRVQTYAADMRAGNWDFNGEAIKLDLDGNLLDGQHRLTAVLEADMTVRMLVLTGLAPKVQETIDTGRSRTFADLLRFRGETNVNVLGATVKAVACYFSNDVPWGPPHPSHRELLTMLDRNPDIRDSVAAMQSAPRWISKTHASTMHFLFAVADAKDADTFFERLITGTGLARRDPIYVLRERLIKEHSKELGGVGPKVKMAFMVRTWNAWRRGDEIAKLLWRAGGASPDRFPHIDGLTGRDEDE